MRIAHLQDHPVMAGRVRNIADGTELEVTFVALMAVGAPEHDQPVGTIKVKVGFDVTRDAARVRAIQKVKWNSSRTAARAFSCVTARLLAWAARLPCSTMTRALA